MIKRLLEKRHTMSLSRCALLFIVLAFVFLSPRAHASSLTALELPDCARDYTADDEDRNRVTFAMIELNRELNTSKVRRKKTHLYKLDASCATADIVRPLQTQLIAAGFKSKLLSRTHFSNGDLAEQWSRDGEVIGFRIMAWGGVQRYVIVTKRMR